MKYFLWKEVKSVLNVRADAIESFLHRIKSLEFYYLNDIHIC